jgi:hypothetical protein
VKKEFSFRYADDGQISANFAEWSFIIRANFNVIIITHTVLLTHAKLTETDRHSTSDSGGGGGGALKSRHSTDEEEEEASSVDQG